MSARLRVDRGALADNYRLYRDAVDGKCGAVVKADGYGLGLAETASVFANLGCEHFFVATAAEGLALRQVLSDGAVYVFEGAFPGTARALADAGLTPVINHQEQLAAWTPYRELSIAVHVDTGMNRLGFSTAVAPEIFHSFSVALLMTHLACADEPEHPLNRVQARRFEGVAKRFPGVPTSVGNSAGCLLGSRYQGDLARPGIGLYGGNPRLGRSSPGQTVATLEAPVIQIRSIEAGESVGYGADWRSDRPRRLAVLGIGYGDGLPRRLSNCGVALLQGERCPIVGRLSMDVTVVDATAVDAAPGDWAELFGTGLPVDQVAREADTIAHELLAGISPRVARVYEGG